MKALILVVLGLVCTSSFAAVSDAAGVRRSPSYQAALAKGAVAAIRLTVSDDDGVGVSNAIVKATFDMTSYSNKASGLTDYRGACMLEGRTRGNSISISVSKDGYYPSSKKICLANVSQPHAVLEGRWQPNPIDESMTLRRIKASSGSVNFGDVLVIPTVNQWVGFDFEKGSFVEQTESSNQADVEFFVEWDGLPPTKSRMCSLKMRFPGQCSGGQYVAIVPESEFPFRHEANDRWTYSVQSVDVVDRAGDPYLTKVNFRENSELIVRTRCILDERGNLLSANYCSIRGLRVSPSWSSNPTVRFVYAYNPTANDLNLECMAK